MEWQPIETYDGTTGVLFFCAEAWPQVFVGTKTVYGFCTLVDEGEVINDHQPTHWMPLPDPPIV